MTSEQHVDGKYVLLGEELGERDPEFNQIKYEALADHDNHADCSYEPLCWTDTKTTTVKVVSLEKLITDLLKTRSGLSNQEIRKALNKQVKGNIQIQKAVVNKTLHQMKDRGIITFQQSGANKLWSLVV
jgi:hypothetical protein